MEILNIGIPELIFIFLIMLIFLGPEGFSQTARGLARMIRRLIHSPVWSDVVKTQREIQDLPTRLVREAGIDEIQQEVARISQQTRNDLNSIRQPQAYIPPPAQVEPEDDPERFDYRAAALGLPANSQDGVEAGTQQPPPAVPGADHKPGQETT